MQATVLKRDNGLRFAAILFACTLIFKVALDLSYREFLVGAGYAYRFSFHFDPLRYAVGLVWCVILFWSIDHAAKKASSFFLTMVYLLEFIPLTTIYSLEGGSTVYYFSVCGAFFLCILVVRCFKNTQHIRRNRPISNAMTVCFALAGGALVAAVVLQNGWPSLTALNIYDVYELRESDTLQISKYGRYLLTWCANVFFPLFLTAALLKKKWGWAAALCAMMMLLYLYTGQKTYLFAIPLLLVIVPWSRRRNYYKEFFFCFCIGFSVLILLNWLSPVFKSVFSTAYDLFCRRSMLLSAQNKFVYYDYFQTHPKLGLYGVFPQWLVNIPDPLQGVDYGYDISAIYYNRPSMNSNTGFLAEGYMRFGHWGTFLLLQLFALLLRMIDGLQKRAGYAMTIGVFLYPVFALADGHLLDSLVFGPWMILFLLLVFYQGDRKRKEYVLETA